MRAPDLEEIIDSAEKEAAESDLQDLLLEAVKHYHPILPDIPMPKPTPTPGLTYLVKTTDHTNIDPAWMYPMSLKAGALSAPRIDAFSFRI
jgi:hypothetical protein